MTPDVWKKIETLFLAASELPPGEQRAYVVATCGDDDEVRDQVLSLLANVEGADREVHRVVAAEAERLTHESDGSLIGRRLGRYRITAPLGEGGMGTVYVAERDDAEYKREVAIKVLRRGGHGAARFRDERQILAALDHPGIVKLLDGGTTDEGLPYLVMDRVSGVPITAYAREHRLSVRERMVLLRRVCAAVKYAHGQLVVHRDLKPSNILVDASGAPKLLDFGIAKLLDPIADGEREGRTQTGLAPFTPEYASPEQARGERVSTSTDVYALGALMYELLADTPAVRANGTPLELLRVICEVDPPRPSTLCPPARRTTIAGDLDNIVMKALAKDPAQRYDSVQRLDDDLANHLTGLPVLARNATWRYRAAKFVGRNRGKLAVASAAAVALGALSIVSLREARRADNEAEHAQRRFAQVRKLAQSLVFDLDDKIRDLKGSTAAREFVVTRALEYLDSLAAEAGDDPVLARELALAYMKIGDIQGDAYEPNLGLPREGLESYRKAKQILDRLAREHHDVRQARATEQYGEGFLLYTLGDAQPAIAALDAATATANALPDGAVDDALVMRGYVARSQASILAGNTAEAATVATSAIAAAQRWIDRASGDEARYWRGVFYEVRAYAEVHLADADKAIVDLRAATADYDAIVRTHPADARYARERYIALMRLSSMYGPYSVDTQIWSAHVDDPRGFDETSALAVDIAEHFVATDPSDARAPTELADILAVRGATVADTHPQDGLVLLDRALAIYGGLDARARAEYYVRQNEWFSHCARGLVLARLGRRDEAIAEAEAGVAIVNDGRSTGHEDEAIRARFAAGRVYAAVGDSAAATAHFAAVRTALDARLAAGTVDIGDYIGSEEVLAALEPLRPADACVLRSQTLATWKRWPAAPTSFVTSHVAAATARANGCAQKNEP